MFTEDVISKMIKESTEMTKNERLGVRVVAERIDAMALKIIAIRDLVDAIRGEQK